MSPCGLYAGFEALIQGYAESYSLSHGETSWAEAICLHAPIRSRASLETRIGWAYRIDEAGFGPGQSKNMRRWAKMTEEAIVELEWTANSYRDYFFGGPR